MSVPFIYFSYFYVYPNVSWRLLIWGEKIALLTIFTNFHLHLFAFTLFAPMERNVVNESWWSNYRRTNKLSESFLCFPNQGQVSFWSKFLFHDSFSCDINVNLISLSHFFDATMFCFENYNQGTDQIKNKNLKRIIPL